MTKQTSKSCPICECIIELNDENVRRIDGLTIGIGYSKNGWGHRQDYIQFTGEVCHECFEAAQVQILRLRDILTARKGINKEDIFIVGRKNSDSMSEMQKDKPSPNGCVKSLLRFLPRIS